MVNAGDPIPFNPPVPSIPFMTEAYHHVGFGLTLHNFSTPDSSTEQKTGFLPLFFNFASSQDWFHRRNSFNSKQKYSFY